MNTHSFLLEEGVERWNQWRAEHPNVLCNLEGACLVSGYFFEIDFSGLNLKSADLRRACLIGADFRSADLCGADLRGAYLDEANFYGANLTGAKFEHTSLERANLKRVYWFGKQVDLTPPEQLSHATEVLVPTPAATHLVCG